MSISCFTWNTVTILLAVILLRRIISLISSILLSFFCHSSVTLSFWYPTAFRSSNGNRDGFRCYTKSFIRIHPGLNKFQCKGIMCIIIQHPWRIERDEGESLLARNLFQFSIGWASGEAALSAHNEERAAFLVWGCWIVTNMFIPKEVPYVKRQVFHPINQAHTTASRWHVRIQ